MWELTNSLWRAVTFVSGWQKSGKNRQEKIQCGNARRGALQDEAEPVKLASRNGIDLHHLWAFHRGEATSLIAEPICTMNLLSNSCFQQREMLTGDLGSWRSRLLGCCLTWAGRPADKQHQLLGSGFLRVNKTVSPSLPPSKSSVE